MTEKNYLETFEKCPGWLCFPLLSFNWFERFTERQTRSFDADDEITPEILESTRLEEDLSREDKSTIQTASFLLKALCRQTLISCQKKV